MIDNLLTLIALSESGTMQKAATKLHVTQSTVSKRIAELERRLQKKLIQRSGRRVALSAEASRLVEGGKPLIQSLLALISEPIAEKEQQLLFSVAPSILIPWGARALAELGNKMPEVKVEVRSLHSLLSLENLEAGLSHVAIVHGPLPLREGFMALDLYYQDLCIIPSGLNRLKAKNGVIEVLTIEPHTDAGKEIKRQLPLAREGLPWTLRMNMRGQSFTTITQLARAGLGHGLVPREVARTMGIEDSKLVKLPASLRLPVCFVVRSASFRNPVIESVYKNLKSLAR